MIKIVDRHIFSEWFKCFTVTIGLILAFLVLQDMYNDLLDLLRLGATATDVWRYYTTLIPNYIVATVPLALLVSLLYALGKLHQNLEIIALRASGLSLLRITRSLWLAAALLTGTLIIFNTYIVPKATEQSHLIHDNLRFSNEARQKSQDKIGVIYNLCFDNQAAHRLWFMNRFSEYTYQGYGVTVHVKNSLNQETKRVAANEAFFDDVSGHWVFVKGREITFNPEDGEPIKSESFEKKSYAEFTETPYLMQALSKDPQDLSLRELGQILNAILIKDNKRLKSYEIQRQKTLASPFACLVVVAIAIPFATRGVRTNPMIGTAEAAALFAFYYCLTSLSHFAGTYFGIHSVIATWLPNAIMLGVALFLHRKSY